MGAIKEGYGGIELRSVKSRKAERRCIILLFRTYRFIRLITKSMDLFKDEFLNVPKLSRSKRRRLRRLRGQGTRRLEHIQAERVAVTKLDIVEANREQVNNYMD